MFAINHGDSLASEPARGCQGIASRCACPARSSNYGRLRAPQAPRDRSDKAIPARAAVGLGGGCSQGHLRPGVIDDQVSTRKAAEAEPINLRNSTAPPIELSAIVGVGGIYDYIF